MEKTIHFRRFPYEAPDAEELQMVERWDILQYPDNGQITPGEGADDGYYD